MTKIKTILSMNILAGMISFQLSASENTPNNKVTGSRLSTNAELNLNPVTVITRKQIELSGMQTVSDILRSSHVNSFGSYRERSGASGGQSALVNMRGLGASRTSVLVNGRRIPGSALFGTSAVNINAIPLVSVERIEILQGGASAIYGADAVAGVINIILRKDYEGAEIEVGVARPERDGGDEEHGSFIVGTNSEKGNMVFAAEFFRRNPVFNADRDYSSVQINGPSFTDTIGVSAFGNTGLALDYSSAFTIGECQSTADGGLYTGILEDPFGIPGTGCGFGYADVEAMTGDVNRYNTFLSANYEINENHTLYFQNTLAKIQSYGRYAPLGASFFIAADAPLNNSGQAFLLGHRFIAHGPRDENFNEFDLDSVIGMNGVIWNDQVNYDAYFRSYSSTINNIGSGYVNSRAIDEAIADGSYNFVNPLDPANAGAVIATAQTTSRDLRTRYNEAALNFDGSAWELSAGTVGWSAGAEWSTENYQDIYDAAREAGNTLGSSGSSASGDRERTSVFGEFAVPLLEAVDMQLAARYDDYSDFGDNISSSINLSWQALDSLLVRASYAEGFKVPNLKSLYSNRIGSFNTLSQLEIISGGNPDLEAEESESFNLGVIWKPIDNLALGVDYYEIDLTKGIQQIGAQTLVNFEANGQPLPAGTAIVRGTNGEIIRIITGNANVSEINVTGMDASVAYSYNTNSVGTFSGQILYSKLFDYSFTSLPGATPFEQLNSVFTPDERTTFFGNWNYGDHMLAIQSYWVDGSGPDNSTHVPSFVNHNITYVYHASWEADISVGIRNLANSDPSISGSWGRTSTNEADLYDVYGRTPFITYKQRF
jgi:iron complex outermembrane receptor protein